MDCEHDFEAARQQCDVDGSKSSLIADVDDRSFPTVDASLQQPLCSEFPYLHVRCSLQENYCALG